MSEHRKETIEYEPDSSPVQMLVVPDDLIDDAKAAVNKLLPRDEEGGDEGGNGDEEVLPLTGSQCHRTRRRDWHCNDTDA